MLLLEPVSFQRRKKAASALLVKKAIISDLGRTSVPMWRATYATDHCPCNNPMGGGWDGSQLACQWRAHTTSWQLKDVLQLILAQHLNHTAWQTSYKHTAISLTLSDTLLCPHFLPLSNKQLFSQHLPPASRMTVLLFLTIIHVHFVIAHFVIAFFVLCHLSLVISHQ